MAIFEALKDWFEQPDFRGCAFINAAVELANPQHPGYQIAIAHKQAIYQYILQLAQDAKLKQPETLARQLMLLAEGAIITSMIEGNSKSAQQAREVASVLIATS